MRTLILISLAVVACGDNYAPPVEDGGSCVIDEECASGVCVFQFGNNPGARCLSVCEEDGTCGDGQACLHHAPTDQAVCFGQCVVADDCQDGWSCLCLDFLCDQRACFDV